MIIETWLYNSTEENGIKFSVVFNQEYERKSTFLDSYFLSWPPATFCSSLSHLVVISSMAQCVEESVTSILLRMSSALNLYLSVMSSDVSRYVTPQVNHVTWRSFNACFLQLSMACIGNNCIYGGVMHLCSQRNISSVAPNMKCKYSVAVPSFNNNVSVVSV